VDPFAWERSTRSRRPIRAGKSLRDSWADTTTPHGYPYNTNQIVDATQNSTTIRTLASDGAGNIITDTRGSTTYNYHYNNRARLGQLTIGSTVTANYTYDGLERMAVH
jgi:hypothetical protein